MREDFMTNSRAMFILPIALSLASFAALILSLHYDIPLMAIISAVLLILSLFTLSFFLRVLNLHNMAKLIGAKHSFEKRVEQYVGEYKDAIRSLEEKNEYLLDKWHTLEQTQKDRFKDLKVAQDIQQNIIPAIFPKHRGVQFAAYSQPIENIGGDFYDVFMLDDDNVFIFIADVAGHGVSAALITAMLKASLHSRARYYTGLEDFIAGVNEDLCKHIKTRHYATALAAVLNVKEKTLRFINASHPGALLCRDGYSSEVCASNAMIIGKFKNAEYKSGVLELKSGDKVLFYTDGVTEASHDKQKRHVYGVDKLNDSFVRHYGKSIFHTLEALKSDLSYFLMPRLPEDDFTFLLFTIE